MLYVHGDTHTFRVDQPKILGSTRSNFTRVEVYGPSDEHWVRVDIDPSNLTVSLGSTGSVAPGLRLASVTEA